MGNPNNNAVLFLFFSIFFFPEKGADLRKRIIFYVSVFAVFACQSRTGFIALAVVYFLGAWLLHFSARNYFFDLLIFSGMYGVEILLGNIYIGSLAGNIMQQHSVRGRLETWKMLWEMIRLKPVLGYGPYKEYFYDNKIYPENEYILYTWRYGFAGLLIYCWWLGYSVFTGWRDRQRRESINLLLFTVVMVITAITNTPLTSTYILIMFAILSGLYFAGKNPNVAIE
jgi:O-antigen ligase